MEQPIANRMPVERQGPSWARIGLLGLAIVALLVGGFLLIRSLSGGSAAPIPPTGERVSPKELESRHGLQIRLIGVTAAGGMIDFRMKITDAQKAQRFLEDPANLPQLVVAESGVALMAAEGLDDDIEWENGGVLFNFYPNDNGVIEPGTPVIVQFGTLQLEPVEAQ